jgi:hypothetical protein
MLSSRKLPVQMLQRYVPHECVSSRCCLSMFILCFDNELTCACRVSARRQLHSFGVLHAHNCTCSYLLKRALIRANSVSQVNTYAYGSSFMRERVPYINSSSYFFVIFWNLIFLYNPSLRAHPMMVACAVALVYESLRTGCAAANKAKLLEPLTSR